jgi:hypothetical protein|tara:strand:+ start:278 stop:484 length:207 start_codon:yes stop_codon:yes gene_type:complete
MKSFLQIREATSKGKVVFKKKINRIDVVITKETGRLPFVVYIDGDKLDAFKNQKDAEKSATETIKELT